MRAGGLLRRDPRAACGWSLREQLLITRRKSLYLLLCVFNLMPVPPLDGSKVLQHLGGPAAERMLDQIAPYGMMIVLLALFVGAFDVIFGPFFALLGFFLPSGM